MQNRGLTGLWRRDDERALALTNRHDQVDDAGGQDLRIRFQAQSLVGIQRCQLIKVRALLSLFRIDPIDGIDLHQLVVLAAVAAIAVGVGRSSHLHLTSNGIARAQAQPAHDVFINKDVRIARAVPGGAQEGDVIVYNIQDAADCLQLIALAHLQVIAAAVVIIITPATPAIPAVATATAVTAVKIIIVIAIIAVIIIAVLLALLVSLIIGAILGVIAAILVAILVLVVRVAPVVVTPVILAPVIIVLL